MANLSYPLEKLADISEAKVTHLEGSVENFFLEI